MDRLSKALERAKGSKPATHGSGGWRQSLLRPRVMSTTISRRSVFPGRYCAETELLQPWKMGELSIRTNCCVHGCYALCNRMGGIRLGITSAGPNVGKTLTSVNLAISISLKDNSISHGG